jgi:hypothetical protein
MQKYILLFSVVQSKPKHTGLQHVIRLPISAQRAIISPDTENHEMYGVCFSWLLGVLTRENVNETLS